jgi:uncharacterized membrane protein
MSPAARRLVLPLLAVCLTVLAVVEFARGETFVGIIVLVFAIAWWYMTRRDTRTERNR